MKCLILCSILTIFPLSVYAQLSPSPARLAEAAAHTPEWQLALDVIKSKAKVLMQRNAKLMDEYNTSVAGIQKAQIDQRDLKLKNEALRQEVKQRRKRSEEQIQIDQLNKHIKAKDGNILALQSTLKELQRDIGQQEKKTQLRKLKASEVEIHVKRESTQVTAINALSERSAIENDEEYNRLREKLAQERKEEGALKEELEAAKKNALNPAQPAQVNESQLKTLQDKVESLSKQKEDLQKLINNDNNQTNQRYLQLMSKKKELEAKIKEFEAQLNQLKEPATFGLLDPKQKKKIIRQMAQMDNRNAQLRQKISDLKDDVSVLREQVTRLERRTKGAGKVEK